MYNDDPNQKNNGGNGYTMDDLNDAIGGGK